MRKRSLFRLYYKSFTYLGSARKKYLFGVALGAFELALLFAMPYVNQELIDIVTGVSRGNIMVMLSVMLALFLCLVPPVVYGKYLQAAAAAEGTAALRKTMFRHLAHMPCDTLTRYKTGDYITRLTGDADRTTGVFSAFSMANLIRFAVVFPVALAMLLASDWRIGAAGVVYGGINLAFSMYLNPLAKRLEGRAKEEIASSASFLVEALRSIPVIRVFVLHDILAERYREVCSVIRDRRMRYQTVIGITYGTVDFFAQSAQAVGFIIGIVLADGEVALGRAVFNATLMGMMADSVYRLSTFLLLAQSHLVSMERVYELLDHPLEDLDRGSREIDRNNETAVEFKGVSFSYDGKEKVIDGFDLVLRRGEHLAIAGESGGGKSTVIKLMEGFYRPSGGEIFYFGRPGKELSLAAIRDIFAYVPQECTLFDGSIRENIALARPEAGQDEIERAARIAGIHDFILGLPDGYGTQVGERGGQLSGGQRQRIAIARGVLKGASVLLLDEATAALDSATEKEVRQCLEQAFAGMTTVTIAHRQSSIQNADRILVMEGGKVVEEKKVFVAKAVRTGYNK